MAWILLIVAGLFEVFGVTMINEAAKTRKWCAYALLIVGFSLSFFFLHAAMRTLSMGTAYAIWTGIGAAGGAVVGMLFYGEARDWRRILWISVIIAAAAGLKLMTA